MRCIFSFAVRKKEQKQEEINKGKVFVSQAMEI